MFNVKQVMLSKKAIQQNIFKNVQDIIHQKKCWKGECNLSSKMVGGKKTM